MVDTKTSSFLREMARRTGRFPQLAHPCSVIGAGGMPVVAALYGRYTLGREPY